MNKREDLVRRIVNQKANWIIGEWENEVEDGNVDEMPTKEELINTIYDEVINIKQLNGLKVEKDIRFVGTKRILEMIENKVKKEME